MGFDHTAALQYTRLDIFHPLEAPRS